MLVLSRKEGEVVQVGDDTRVRVVRIKGNRVTLAFEAPDDVKIIRAEISAHLFTSSEPLPQPA